MPAGGLVTVGVMAAVSLTSTLIGASQKSKALAAQQAAALQQNQQNVLLNNANNANAMTIGSQQDVTSVVDATISGELAGDAMVAAAATNQEGNILLVIGASTAVIALAVLVFRRKKAA